MSLFFFTENKGKLLEFQDFLGQTVMGLQDLQSLAQSHLTHIPVENADYFIPNAFVKALCALFFVRSNFPPDFISRIVVDDSGLCLPDLGFLPGVHSATYAGIPKNDENNRKKLAFEIKKSPNSYLVGKEKRLKAFFVCFLIELQLNQTLKVFDTVFASHFCEGRFFQTQDIVSIEKTFLNNINLEDDGGHFSQCVSLSMFHPQFSKNLKLNIYYGFCCGEVAEQEQNLILGAGHGYDSLFFPKGCADQSFASMTMREKNKLSHRGFATAAFRASL
jgi:inosine/xanthosine triphosphate pyrophosphatase family protein